MHPTPLFFGRTVSGSGAGSWSDCEMLARDEGEGEGSSYEAEERIGCRDTGVLASTALPILRVREVDVKRVRNPLVDRMLVTRPSGGRSIILTGAIVDGQTKTKVDEKYDRSAGKKKRFYCTARIDTRLANGSQAKHIVGTHATA